MIAEIECDLCARQIKTGVHEGQLRKMTDEKDMLLTRLYKQRGEIAAYNGESGRFEAVILKHMLANTVQFLYVPDVMRIKDLVYVLNICGINTDDVVDKSELGERIRRHFAEGCQICCSEYEEKQPVALITCGHHMHLGCLKKHVVGEPLKHLTLLFEKYGDTGTSVEELFADTVICPFCRASASAPLSDAAVNAVSRTCKRRKVALDA